MLRTFQKNWFCFRTICKVKSIQFIPIFYALRSMTKKFKLRSFAAITLNVNTKILLLHNKPLWYIQKSTNNYVTELYYNKINNSKIQVHSTHTTKIKLSINIRMQIHPAAKPAPVFGDLRKPINKWYAIRFRL